MLKTVGETQRLDRETRTQVNMQSKKRLIDTYSDKWTKEEFQSLR